MNRIHRLVFSVALLVFGIASAGGVRPVAAQATDCGGEQGELCNKDTTKTCTRRTICGLRIGNLPGLITCCSEWLETTYYYYYPAPH